MSAAPAPGERVRVRDWDPPSHMRTPAYIRGKTGTVVRVHGAFPNPEALAYGHDGKPAKTLCLVRFNQRDIWSDYDGPGIDTLEIDIYEHWLERLEETAP
jgi:hypothetical protein